MENQSKEIQTVEQYLPSDERTVHEVEAQVQKIQMLMKSVMTEGEHYGTVPGCGAKKTLLKAGAEKICFVFKLAPEYQITMRELPGGHREYEVISTLYDAAGNKRGQGVGCCSTMESKYRYRNTTKNTGITVPKEYWDSNRDKKTIGGAGFIAEKVDGEWMICEKGERIEYDNPADYYNTVLKIGKKRALTDNCLTTTAASDCFTQDLEDMADNGVLPQAEVMPSTKPKLQPTRPMPQAKPATQAVPKPAAPQAPQREPGDEGQENTDGAGPVRLVVTVDYRDAATRTQLKADGFKWDANMKAWFITVPSDDVQGWKEKYENLKVI